MRFNVNRPDVTLQSGHQARFLAVLLPLLLLAGMGCKTVTKTVSVPFNAMYAVMPDKAALPPDPTFIQLEELRSADALFQMTSSSLDEYSSRVNTPEARLKALKWKLSLGSSIVNMATGPNPTANLLDLVTFTTLMRGTLEDAAPKATPPGSLDDWLNHSRVLETNAWMMSGFILTSNQQQVLRTAIAQWRQQNPAAKNMLFARPEELATLIRKIGHRDSEAQGVFEKDRLDPMADLDPAIREVTRTRLFAERAMFAAQRTSTLMRWQVELLTEQVMDQQQIVMAVQSVDRISRASESISQTAALMPNLIASERQAFLDALMVQEGKLAELSAQVTRTLTAGNQMSDSLNTTLITLTALMKRFGVGEPSTTPPDTNAPPFNILDYAHTADQFTKMAAQMDILVKDANGTLDTVSGQTRDDAKSVLNRAFLLTAVLIVLIFACAFIYRRTGRKGAGP